MLVLGVLFPCPRSVVQTLQRLTEKIDIIGPNSIFVDQSGTFPKKFSDFKPADTEDMINRNTELLTQALEVECGVEQTEGAKRFWRILGGLGSHDLSTMREALGMPTSVAGFSYNFPFWK
jgi:hypothetical protein